MAYRTRVLAVAAAVLLALPLAMGLVYFGGKSLQGQAYAGEPTLDPIRIGPVEPCKAGPRQYRLLLDAAALKALDASAASKSRAFSRVKMHCDAHLSTAIGAGYEAFDWADATAELALCWHATKDKKYAAGAIKYLSALLEDRRRMGDGQGGARVVRADSGYGIRTRGVYAALGYDWLRDAPGMTPELRHRIVGRLDEWLTWYGREGYLNNEPISNYFWGYFTALNFAGLAVGDEAPQGRRWLASAKHLLEQRVLPTFKARLHGGDWPEGWQYGELVAMHVSLVAQAYRTGAGIELARQLPWLRDVVQHHTHAMLPNQASVYGGGTWAERPAKASGLAMTALSLALDRIDDQRAAQARFLAEDVFPPLAKERAWLALLADRPGRPKQDPRPSKVLSHHVTGTGLTLMRSDWGKRAVFTSLKIGPRLAPDHQDKDEGHFELWRGSDGLLVDAGDSEGSATINHNCLLIDDAGRVLTYSPNQGVWGRRVATNRYADDGVVAVASGEYADAYAPACVREGCDDRAVSKAVRTLVFARPSLLVIDDRVTLDEGKERVAWTVHVPVSPQRDGSRTSASVGQSRVDVQTLLPEAATIRTVREPTASGEGPHRQNSVWGPLFRVEVDSARGQKERRFLHWIVAGPRNISAPLARLIEGTGLSGAVGTVDQRRVAVLLADDADRAGKAVLETGVGEIVIAGLRPERRYRITTQDTGRGCALDVAVAANAKHKANRGGFVRVGGCPRKGAQRGTP